MYPFINPVLSNASLVVFSILVMLNMGVLALMLQYWKQRDWTWWVNVAFSVFYVVFTTPFIVFKIYTMWS